MVKSLSNNCKMSTNPPEQPPGLSESASSFRNNNGPSIMEPIEMNCSSTKLMDLNDAMDNDEENLDRLTSLNIEGDDYPDDYLYNGSANYKSFLLLDGTEKLRIHSAEAFVDKLECAKGNANVKVISIFGNTGDGKSHTLNHTFFKGEEVFKTSSEQDSCTLGVWAALQPTSGVLCLDTEGLLGVGTSENQRTRMLLKVLAISDIVIYRTRSERLHSDMFTFLGTASKAFCLHFSAALQTLSLTGPPQALGPAVIIFHETRNTNVLHSTVNTSPEDILRERFAQLNMDLDAFSSIKYVGIQSSQPSITDYNPLKAVLKFEILNKTVRSARQLSIVYDALRALNAKFSGEICERPVNPFPEQYFTCSTKCESCGERCERSMGHISEGKDHKSAKRCRHQHQFENKVYLCKQCLYNGNEEIVTVTKSTKMDTSWVGIAKFAWSGSVIECKKCGEIYRSRQYWYGNKCPEDFAVKSEIVHVWKGSMLHNNQLHSARMLLDGVSYLAETVSNLSAQPTNYFRDWATDKIAPAYWVPNAQIINCHSCKVNFEQKSLSKHHCRGCGQGFCNLCTKYEMPVPKRGWTEAVRVCKDCRDHLVKSPPVSPSKARQISQNVLNNNIITGENNVRARRVGEVVINTLSSVASVLEYPKDLIKDSARPSYWVKDEHAPNCAICNLVFGCVGTEENGNNICPVSGEVADTRRHHCRSCGEAVCNACSRGRRVVPERGWTTEVRICDSCSNLPDKN